MKEMSNGEKAIKGVLDKYNIDYVMEYPLLIKEQKDGDIERLRIWYPDFWLPKYSIIIEFFGLMDNPAYAKGKEDKIKAYKKLDIDCIPVYPKTIQGDLKSYLLIHIKQLINEKVRHFENRNKNGQ